MKTNFFIIILIKLLLILPVHAKNQCAEYLSLLDGSVDAVVLAEPIGDPSQHFAAEDLIPVQVVKHPDPILLKPGVTSWGYYECDRCSNEVSAMPDERQCQGCGKPHTTERLDEIAPAVFRKSRVSGRNTFNEIYLVNPGRLTTDKAMDRLAKTGVADECPFCSRSDFDLSVGCQGCGAETVKANDIRKYALKKQRAALLGSTRVSSLDREMADGRGLPPLNVDVMSPANPSGPTLSEIETQLTAIDNENSGRRAARPRDSQNTESRPANQRLIDKINLTRRGAMILAASTMIAATPIGYIWGNTTYTHMAEVTSISTSAVTVEYFDNSGQVEDVVLVRTPEEDAQWRIGEQVELYFVNWRMGNPTSGLRGNADILLPQ